jgi:putative FmdB family regulatory protein
MPSYIFECKSCGHEEEKQYNMDEVPSVIDCSVCEGEMKQNFQKTHCTTSTIIPPHMKASSRSKLPYGKKKKEVW